MSRVIRGGGGGGDDRRVVPGEVFDAQGEAQRIVAEAREQAEGIVAEARERADTLRSEAAREGREAGRAEAAEQLARAAALRDQALEQAEAQIVQLALAAAKRIVGKEIALEPERVRGIVRDVVGRARRAGRLTARVHPDDVQAVRALESEHDHPLAVEPDDAIARGGCIVDTDVGRIDARIEVQLEALERALLGE